MASRRTKSPACFLNGRYLIRTLFCGLLLCLFSACSSNNYAPISNLERPKTVTKGSYVVRKGDTLFSIAWRYGRDYRELAKSNGIRWPYTIFSGQRISLSKRRANTKKWTPTASNQPIKKPLQKNTQKQTTQQKQKAQVKSQPLITKGPIVWYWPAKGPIISKFSGSNKGIDIKGKTGQSVNAAAAGTVVYAGSGLVGYGNLIIIKHSEVFLSAYAHNKKILVREKNKIKAGAKIAEIGSSGASETKLHFEIRKNGKPVNPLWYLPK